MRFGIFLPIFNELADPDLLGALAAEAEDAGWHGVFFWDHVYYRPPVTDVSDAWIAMAVAAERTERVLLGPMVTPLARRRPHVLARQAVALDRLSGGRFVLGVGLGLDRSGGELVRFGEETDDRRRAGMLDEALALLPRLFSSQPVDHRGEHYTAADVTFRPGPVHGHIPVWVAARWPYQRPLKRAASQDGLFIIEVDAPSDLAASVGHVRRHRPAGLDGFEVVVAGAPGSDPGPWAEAGATWWLTQFDPFEPDLPALRRTIEAGPPTAV